MTVQQCLQKYTPAIDILDCELILAHALKVTRVFIATHPEYEIPHNAYVEIEESMRRRRDHEPLAYILGTKEFYGLPFLVTRDTLIPRPETELMVDEILKDISHSDQKTLIVDVGTGSGCIVISLAHEHLHGQHRLPAHSLATEHFSYVAIDISRDALIVAEKNAKKNSVEKNITFLQSDLIETLAKKITLSSFEKIIFAANLPYLSNDIYEAAMPDVKNHEPETALVSDNNGLAHYEKLLKQMSEYSISNTQKNPSSFDLYFEISPEQNIPIQALIHTYFPQAILTSFKDLTNRARLIKIQTRAQ